MCSTPWTYTLLQKLCARTRYQETARDVNLISIWLLIKHGYQHPIASYVHKKSLKQMHYARLISCWSSQDGPLRTKLISRALSLKFLERSKQCVANPLDTLPHTAFTKDLTCKLSNNSAEAALDPILIMLSGVVDLPNFVTHGDAGLGKIRGKTLAVTILILCLCWQSFVGP